MASTLIAVFGQPDRLLGEMLSAAGAKLQTLPMTALVAVAGQSHGPLPEVAVIDLRGEGALPPAVALLRRQHRHVGIVILASTMDPSLMLEAMRAGVNEFVAEPLTSASVIAALQRVMAPASDKTVEGEVFALVGAKGGVGTTTIAVNVATALSRIARTKSLLLDLHLANGDAALFLGAEPRFSTSDALENIHRMDAAYLSGLVTTTKSGVHLLASAERPVPPVDRPEKVRDLIAFGAQHYRYIVLDVPRSDMTMLDSLEQAASITVVANQELPTVRRAGALALTLRQRYGKERVGVVINRFDKSADINREDVERVIGGSVRHVIPSDYRIALEGLNKGQPIVVENGNRLAGSLASLARELARLESVQPAKKEERPAGLFGRLATSRS